MKGIVFTILLFSLSLPVFSQNVKDSIIYENYLTPLTPARTENKKRIKLVTIANAVGYGGSLAGFYSAWYSNYPQSSFHFFDDNKEWKQVDKVGHAYGGYISCYGTTEMWKWAGMKQRKAAVLGTVSAFAYESVIETLDGFSAEWGWSWGDIGANVFGSGLFLGQELIWGDQRIKYKFSFHKENYGAKDLNDRANYLYGQTWQERMIKDYNNQTYWLSANLKSFMPKSNLPPWLNVAFGYGADGMFGAVENVGKDKEGNVFDRRDIQRYRQYYLSPDIDLTKIKTKSKFLKLTLGFLNAFKFPMPSLEYNSKGKFAFHLVHF